MVISEAKALGVPVVATDVGGIRYMIDNDVNGFVIEPDNIEQLVDRIRFLFDNPEIRENMGRNCKKVARQKHHPSIVAHKTYDVYMRVLQG